MTTTTSDCGCGDTGSPVKATRSRQGYRSMIAAPAGASTSMAGVTSAGPGGTRVLDGFHGLNPEDGLFLRADHLKRIQDYARSLTTALATASGPGIVHGLGVRRIGDQLEVSPGLAVSPGGRLLRLPTTVQLALDDSHVPARPADGFWRVELHWAWGTSGSDPVFGSLCNDACGDGGTSIAPWLDEGVEIRIVVDGLPGLDAVPFARRHNWLASTYFERERAGGQPWLVPAATGSRVDMWSHDWEDATTLPPEAGVPLALLQDTDKKAYDLDVWAARRLVDGTCSNATWRDRLAMRPWSVFLAQVLEFEAEITGVTLEGHPKESAADVSLVHFFQESTRDLLEATQEFIGTLKPSDLVRNRGTFQRMEEVVHKTADNPLATTQPPPVALQLGLGELPPAGYLNVHNLPGDIEGDLRAFFGPNVDLHPRRLRADQVADEVIAAQHRDRIPLEPPVGRRPQVDILIPVMPADKSELYTDAYGWVAFVRRGPEVEFPVPPEPPAPETEDVKVYLLFRDEQQNVREFTDADLKAAMATPLGTLTFPKGGWAYPGSRVSMKTLDALRGTRALALVALTAGDDPPLAATRAGLFGASLDSGNPPPVYVAKPQAEAIVVVAAIVLL